MNRLCRVFLSIFAGAYLLPIALLLIGTFGLFGNAKDPLAGIFLIPLGLPWKLMLGKVPETVRPWLAAGAPAVNLAILWLICRAAAVRTVRA